MFELETCPVFYYYVSLSKILSSLDSSLLDCTGSDVCFREHKMHHCYFTYR